MPGATTAPAPRRRLVGALVGLAAAVLALGPALRPGYLLFYDMVFVPRLRPSPWVLGVDGSVPRAVPNDLLVAAASTVLPGWVVQHVLLVAVFVGVGAGVGGLLRSRLGAGLAAAVACWNPYLAERLAIGHWGFLLGYAVLPWVLWAAASVREGAPRSRSRLAVTLVVAAATGSTGAVLAVLLTLVVLLLPGVPRPAVQRWADVGSALLVAVLANAPWWWPFLTAGEGFPADADGVAAFMARADTPFGVLGSLLTGGGIWNRGVWFSERESWLVAGLALLGVLLALLGWARSGRWRADAAARGITVAGTLGLLLAGASALPGGDAAVTWVVTHVPGGGLLRDSQKFVALWVLLLAVAAGATAEQVVPWLRRRAAPVLPATLLGSLSAALLVVTLPGPAWGAGGRWEAVSYPDAVDTVARRLDASPPGAVAVFPWTLYRRYDWNGDRVVLDPWQRLTSRRVLVNDDLPLSDRLVRGESRDAARVAAALRGRQDVPALLRRLGVRYVIVQTDQPRGPGVPDLSGRRPVLREAGLALYDLGAVPAQRAEPSVPLTRWTGWAAGGCAVLLAAGWWLADRRRRTATARD